MIYKIHVFKKKEQTIIPLIQILRTECTKFLFQEYKLIQLIKLQR